MKCPRCGYRLEEYRLDWCPRCRWTAVEQIRPSVLDKLADDHDCKKEMVVWAKGEHKHGDEFRCSCGVSWFHYYQVEPNRGCIYEGRWNNTVPEWMVPADWFSQAWRPFLEKLHPELDAQQIEELIHKLKT